jgi:hypothetical protein
MEIPKKKGGVVAYIWPGPKPQKSDLRNHHAIVQPRLCDCLMVTQITLTSKTEGPHGLPSGRRSGG